MFPELRSWFGKADTRSSIKIAHQVRASLESNGRSATESFDRGEQSLGSDWLAQKVIGLDWFDDFTDRGKHNYRDSTKPFVGELRFAKSSSVEPRQHQVQQNQVGQIVFCKHLERRDPIDSGRSAITGNLQEIAQS
jgi:hypothetical protein